MPFLSCVFLKVFFKVFLRQMARAGSCRICMSDFEPVRNVFLERPVSPAAGGIPRPLRAAPPLRGPPAARWPPDHDLGDPRPGDHPLPGKD